MKYMIVLSKEAAKALERMDRKLESRTLDKLRDIERDPRNKGKALKSLEDILSVRVRVGSWRILCQVCNDRKQAFIMAIRPRGHAYRGL